MAELRNSLNDPGDSKKLTAAHIIQREQALPLSSWLFPLSCDPSPQLWVQSMNPPRKR